MADAVDIRIDHQRIKKSQGEHDPERRVRKNEEEREEVKKMKQTGKGRNNVPTRVREDFRVSGGTFDTDRIWVHFFLKERGTVNGVINREFRVPRKFCRSLGCRTAAKKFLGEHTGKD